MNELKIGLKETLGFAPKVLGHLASIDDTNSSYKYYRLRHPGGIFNLSANYVLRDFIKLTTKVIELEKDYETHKQGDITENLESLIRNIFKFYDSCFEIIQGCCKEHAPPRRR